MAQLWVSFQNMNKIIFQFTYKNTSSHQPKIPLTEKIQHKKIQPNIRARRAAVCYLYLVYLVELLFVTYIYDSFRISTLYLVYLVELLFVTYIYDSFRISTLYLVYLVELLFVTYIYDSFCISTLWVGVLELYTGHPVEGGVAHSTYTSKLDIFSNGVMNEMFLLRFESVYPFTSLLEPIMWIPFYHMLLSWLTCISSVLALAVKIVRVLFADSTVLTGVRITPRHSNNINRTYLFIKPFYPKYKQNIFIY